MFADEDLIPISALQHHLFCPRQCALIHVDGLWAENRLTVEGRRLHERSDTPGYRTRPANSASASGVATRTVRSLPLVCHRLGLTGKADQVEFALDANGLLAGPPRPIEHKRGSPKRLDHDRVQLAAQALCLEEMFEADVPEGDLFYHQTRRRERVAIDDRLRSLTTRLVNEVRANITANRVPPARKQAKCRNCSLLHLCLPAGTGPTRDPARYLSRSLSASLADTADAS